MDVTANDFVRRTEFDTSLLTRNSEIVVYWVKALVVFTTLTMLVFDKNLRRFFNESVIGILNLCDTDNNSEILFFLRRYFFDSLDEGKHDNHFFWEKLSSYQVNFLFSSDSVGKFFCS